MDKQKYIELFKKKINEYLPEYQVDHKIDDQYIYSNFIDKWYKIKIDDAVTIINLYQSALSYLYQVKVNDIIRVNSYGSDSYAKIKKINFSTKRKRKNGDKFLSSFTALKDYGNGYGNYSHKIGRQQVYFNGILIEDIHNIFLNVTRFISFSGYDVERIEKIINILSLTI